MRRILIYTILSVVLGWLLMCAGFGLPLDLALALVLGWIFFLVRVIPQVRVHWEGVATALVCLSGFSAGLHWFLGWLYRETGESPRRWKPRWTGSIVALIVLMFVAGMAAVGTTHQVGWLLTSREPLAGMSRFAVYRAMSTNNLKQLGLGHLNYRLASGDDYPRLASFDRDGRPLHGWQTTLIPYMEKTDLLNRINMNLPWDDPSNAGPFRRQVQVYINPGIRPSFDEDGVAYAPSHYAANAYLATARSLKDVPDGTSSTILAGEVAGGFRPWGDPINWRDPALGLNRSPAGFGGPSPGGANLLMLDGSVRFVKDRTDPRVMKALGTPAGREVIGADAY